jgi:hypothetical protein
LQHSLPTDHPHLKMAKKNVEYVKKKLWMIVFCYAWSKERFLYRKNNL